MTFQYDNSNNGEFKLANIDEGNKRTLDEFEQKLKENTGKDMVLIAWERNK